MNDRIRKINTNGVRTDITRHLKDHKGEVIYITKCHKLVAELRVYTEKIRTQKEFEIAKKMLQSAQREHIKIESI